MADPQVSIVPSSQPRIEDLGRWLDPEDALRHLCRRRHPVLLLSGQLEHSAARFSILACDPLAVIAARGGILKITWAPETGCGEERHLSDDPLELLRTLVPARLTVNIPGLPFLGGAIGYLGYGLRRTIETLPGLPSDPLGHPDLWFGIYDQAVIFDHRERRVAIVSNPCRGVPKRQTVRDGDRLGEFREMLLECSSVRGEWSTERRPPRCAAILEINRRGYMSRIERALEYIAAGDIYQVNLSHRMNSPLRENPVALFCLLSERNPAPFSAYVDTGEFQIISASPERFLSLRGDQALSSPIKGTRPRGRSRGEDERLARELLASGKDRAENVMITDLVRNDLGRVCEAGSVRVEKLCALESFATVHHLVSTISGRVRPDRDRVDVLRSLFPGGSMTGAPKVRAMEIIDELEGEERGVYSGSVGYLSFCGAVDLNIVIRTILSCGGTAHLQVGGAIVAESDPGREFRETLDKARALLEVLRADLKNPDAA